MAYGTALLGPNWTVDGLTINGEPDATGLGFPILTEQGWFGTGAVKPMRTDKPAAPGTFSGPEYKAGKAIAFTGEINAPTQSSLRNAVDQILGVCAAPNVLYPLVCVDEAGSVRTTYVRLDGQTVVQPKSTYSCTYSIQFFAPDARRFGVAHTLTIPFQGQSAGGVNYNKVVYTPGVVYGQAGAPGGGQLTNLGTAPADMVFTLSGYLTTPTLTNGTTRDSIQYTQIIPAGATVTIDTAAGSCIYQGTQNYRTYLVPNQWFQIPPRSTIALGFQTINVTDTGSLTVTWSDSYL